MPYFIAAPCIDVMDKSCIEECPVDCIYEGDRKLYINPRECIDCGACEPVCPETAIFTDIKAPAEVEASPPTTASSSPRPCPAARPRWATPAAAPRSEWSARTPRWCAPGQPGTSPQTSQQTSHQPAQDPLSTRVQARGITVRPIASNDVKGVGMAKSGRVFVRGITSMEYDLKDVRDAQLAAPRVRNDSVVVDDAKVGHSGDSAKSKTWWRLGPGDDPFLTQTLQVHFVQLPPHSSNSGHGHQNEAAFYILEGRGYEIHDGQRYDWSKDDLVFVHTDSIHRHFNPYDEQATCLVIKAKCSWMFLGLIQQGKSGPIANEEKFGPREDWSQIWTPGVLDRKKVVKPPTPPGRPPRWAGSACCPRRTAPTSACSAWTVSSWTSRPAAGPANAGTWPTRCSTCSAAPATACTGRSRPSWTRSTTRGSPRSRPGTRSPRATPCTCRRTRSPSTSARTASRCACCPARTACSGTWATTRWPTWRTPRVRAAGRGRGGAGMTEPGIKEQGAAAAVIWRDTDFAKGWAEGDSYRDLLSFPRHMAAVLIAADNPEPGIVVDIGSGPGDFLAVMLEQFPQARGVWTDVSEAMFDMARERLAPFGTGSTSTWST